MFIDDATFTRNGKTYRRVLLRNSYRFNGQVRHDTLANLSHCSEEEIRAIKLALNHKGQLTHVRDLREVGTRQGLAVGAVWVLHQLAKRLGRVKGLGQSRTAKLALWLVLASVIAQGSRLSAVRLAQQHAVCDRLGLEAFNEEDLYQAMDWLDEQQPALEEVLPTATPRRARRQRYICTMSPAVTSKGSRMSWASMAIIATARKARNRLSLVC